MDKTSVSQFMVLPSQYCLNNTLIPDFRSFGASLDIQVMKSVIVFEYAVVNYVA